MTSHWGPGSALWRVTSAWLRHGQGPWKESRGTLLSGDPEQAPEQGVGEGQQFLLLREERWETQLPAPQIQRAWPGSSRLVQDCTLRAEQTPPRGSTPTQGHMCTKELQEVTTVPSESESPPAVAGDPHLLLALREGPGWAGGVWHLRKAGQALRGPLLGKVGPCQPLLAPPVLASGKGGCGCGSRAAAPGRAMESGLSSSATRGSCAASTEAPRAAAGRPGPGTRLAPPTAGAGGRGALLPGVTPRPRALRPVCPILCRGIRLPYLVPPTHSNNRCFRIYIIY